MARTVLIVGANRGIGLQLATSLISRGWTVVASVRPQTKDSGDESVKEIEKLASQILEIDVTDEDTIIEAARTFGSGPLDMLVNMAGLGPGPDNWFDHNAEILKDKYLVNTVGPFLTSTHFHPNLKKAGGVIINVTSDAACISLGRPKDLAYRVSKAALNMLSVTMAKEFQNNGDNIAVVALNPGFVPTRMTNFFGRNNMEECIAGIVNVLEKVGMDDTGKFLDWRGETLPW